MEGLKNYLTAKENQVRKNMELGMPTQEQLSKFIYSFSRQMMEQVVLQAPTHIKKICTEGLKTIGWDNRRNIPLPNTNLSVDSIFNGINEIRDKLDELSPSVEPTSEEIGDLSVAACKLWDLDFNRACPGQDYVINVQEGKKIYEKGDVAEDPLFTFVDEKLLDKPTYQAFIALLDNYIAITGHREIVTAAEKAENDRFLDLIMQTNVMKYCHSYLKAKGKVPESKKGFKDLLDQLWFGLYRRSTNDDSSGFEHVFLGEIKDGAVTGMHNWLQLYLEERKKHLDYLGFIKPRRKPNTNGYRVPKDQQQLISLQFSWHNCIKNVSSSFIGTSPEFEVALYTMCFFDSEEKNIVQCGPYKVEITCYKYISRGKTFIGTSFPSEAPYEQNEAASKIQSQYRGKKARKETNNKRYSK